MVRGARKVLGVPAQLGYPGDAADAGPAPVALYTRDPRQKLASHLLRRGLHAVNAVVQAAHLVRADPSAERVENALQTGVPFENRTPCDRHGIVFIADEIQSGAGRTGTWLAIEQMGVVADLVTMAKSIAGGFPISAVLGRADIMDAPGPPPFVPAGPGGSSGSTPATSSPTA